jgi:hypothetical protein
MSVPNIAGTPTTGSEAARTPWCIVGDSGDTSGTPIHGATRRFLELPKRWLHEALKRFERHQSGGPATGADRNPVANDVAAAASETGGQSTEGNSDREDRSENTQVVVN